MSTFISVLCSPPRSLIHAGKLTALAVSSLERSPKLSDVLTTIKAGFPNSECNFWFGVFIPTKNPAAIIQRIYDEITKALHDPGVQENSQISASRRCP